MAANRHKHRLVGFQGEKSIVPRPGSMVKARRRSFVRYDHSVPGKVHDPRARRVCRSQDRRIGVTWGRKNCTCSHRHDKISRSCESAKGASDRLRIAGRFKRPNRAPRATVSQVPDWPEMESALYFPGCWIMVVVGTLFMLPGLLGLLAAPLWIPKLGPLAITLFAGFFVTTGEYRSVSPIYVRHAGPTRCRTFPASL